MPNLIKTMSRKLSISDSKNGIATNIQIIILPAKLIGSLRFHNLSHTGINIIWFPSKWLVSTADIRYAKFISTLSAIKASDKQSPLHQITQFPS